MFEVALSYVEAAIEDFDGQKSYLDRYDCLALKAQYFAQHPVNKDLTKAIDYYQQAAQVAYYNDKKRDIALAEGTIGTLYTRLNNFVEGKRLLTKSIKWFQENKKLDEFHDINEQDLLGYQFNLAVCFRQEGEFQNAYNTYIAVIDECEQIGLAHLKNECLYGIAVLFVHSGQLEKAIATLLECFETAKLLNDRNRIEYCFKAIVAQKKIFESENHAKQFYLEQIKYSPKEAGLPILFDSIPKAFV